MMFESPKLLSVVLAACFFCVLNTSGVAHAQEQNPLRFSSISSVNGQQANQTHAKVVQPEMHKELPTEVRDAIYNRLPAKNDRNVKSLGQVSASLTTAGAEKSVEQAIHTEDLDPARTVAQSGIPRNKLASIDEVLNALDSNSSNHSQRPSLRTQIPSIDVEDEKLARDSVSTAAMGGRDAQSLMSLFKKIAVSTCIVICLGVGLILIAKQWFIGKTTVSKKVDETTIQIKSSLRLSPKSNLYLVEAGDQMLVVAHDQNGINSVVALTAPFANALDAFSGVDENATEGDSPGTVDTYSMASIGKPKMDSQVEKKLSADEIHQQMEETLNKHGLKELFLKSLVTTK